MDTKQALSKLDPKDDAHWTGDGMPLVETVSKLVGRPVTRKEIIDADPALTRAVAIERVSPAVDRREATGDATGEPRTEVAGDTLTADSTPDPKAPLPIAPTPAPAASPAPAKAPPVPMDPPEQANQVEVPAKVTPEEEKRAQLQAAIDELERDLCEINDDLVELTKDRDRAQRKHTDLLAMRDQGLPGHEDQNGKGIRDYLARQQQTRAARAGRLGRILNDGTKLGEVIDAARGTSRIDAAFGQRRGPVGNVGRPVRPVMGGAIVGGQQPQ